MAISRRSLLRSAPAAAALAPSLANVAPASAKLGVATPYYDRETLATDDIVNSETWTANRVKALRSELADTETNERQFGRRQGMIAPSVDALRSVSHVNKQRILYERHAAWEKERRRWHIDWELFDLIGARS